MRPKVIRVVILAVRVGDTREMLQQKHPEAIAFVTINRGLDSLLGQGTGAHLRNSCHCDLFPSSIVALWFGRRCYLALETLGLGPVLTVKSNSLYQELALLQVKHADMTLGLW